MVEQHSRSLSAQQRFTILITPETKEQRRETIKKLQRDWSARFTEESEAETIVCCAKVDKWLLAFVNCETGKFESDFVGETHRFVRTLDRVGVRWTVLTGFSERIQLVAAYTVGRRTFPQKLGSWAHPVAIQQWLLLTQWLVRQAKRCGISNPYYRCLERLASDAFDADVEEEEKEDNDVMAVMAKIEESIVD